MREAEHRTHWTTRDLADAAGLNPARIRQLLIDGQVLRGHKLGRDWVVPDPEARRWLSSRGVPVDA
jgi:hypothetical protein